MDKHIKFITAIDNLRTIIMKSTDDNEVDFLLEALHEKGEAIRRDNENTNINSLNAMATLHNM